MRNRRALLYLFLSIASGMVAFFAYRAQIDSSQSGVEVLVIETTPVVMTIEDLTPGVPISAGSVEIAEWPSEFVPKGTISSLEEVIDRVSRRTVSAGEPLFSNLLLPVGHQGGLAALIEPKYRAMSVKVDEVIGISGFIRPGSRVDVLAQLRTVDGSRATPFSRTILQNVKVLAINDNLEDARDADADPPSVVTLQVAPLEAQRLAYGAAEGLLQLALRGQSDFEHVALKSTRPKDFLDPLPPRKKVAKKRVKKSAPRPAIESIRGSKSGKDYL
jgi:pilus assembly protein CpaB